MLKSTLIFVIVTFLTLQNMAQNLPPIGAEWYYSMSQYGGAAPPNSEYVVYRAIKDTTYYGINSRKIEREYFRYAGDSILWVPIYLTSRNDSTFYYNHQYQRYLLLYDYTAAVGDTLRFIAPDTALRSIDSTYRLVVDSIKVLNNNGFNNARAFYTTPLDNITISGKSFDLPYLSKVGSTSILLPRTTVTLEHDGPLRCYNDSIVSVNYYGRACDYSIISSITETNDQDELLNIYPIPAKTLLHLTGANTAFDRMIIYDSSGKEVLKAKYSKSVDVNQFRSGVYLIKLIKGEKIVMRKFLVE